MRKLVFRRIKCLTETPETNVEFMVGFLKQLSEIKQDH